MSRVPRAVFAHVSSVAAYVLNSLGCVSRSGITIYRIGATGEANTCGQSTLCMGWKICHLLTWINILIALNLR